MIIIELSEKLTGKKKGAIKGPQSVQNTSRRPQPTKTKPKGRKASLKERRDEQDHERTAKNGPQQRMCPHLPHQSQCTC